MYNSVQRFLLFMVGFTLPLQAFSLINVGVRLTPFKLATAVLLVVGVIATFQGRQRRPDPTTPWVGAFGLAHMVALAQGFMRGVPPGPLVRQAVGFYAILLYYLLIGYVVQDRRSLAVLLWGLMVGGFTTAAPAVLGLEAASSVGRFQGLSGQPNILGVDMTVVIAVGFGLLTSLRSKFLRAVLFGILGFAVMGLLLSLSRTAFVAGLGMGGMWLYRSRRFDALQYAVPALLMLAAVLLMAPPEVTDRFASITSSERRERDGAIQGRYRGFYLGTKAFMTNPLIGIGELAYVPWAQSQPGSRTQKHVIHSSYVKIMVSGGLFKLIPYLMILIVSWSQYSRAYAIARARRSLKDPLLSEYGAMAMFLQVAVLGSVVISGLTAHAEQSKTGWLMLALAPVVLNLVRQRVNEIESPTPAEAPESFHYGALPERRHA